ncbi:MAG TPA: TldD/PmbA family protein, partial [candidate division Zixibacteria bacterium]|nr:TldD/PmbA family protein [candidate division Zixibacteria bacterium]
DGTFLVEKGKIVSGIKNLRFTESMLQAFGRVEAISKESELIDTWWGD